MAQRHAGGVGLVGGQGAAVPQQRHDGAGHLLLGSAPEADHRLGISPPSFDKQFVRDYLETLDWDKTPPAPSLPEAIVERTSAKYQEAYERLTGSSLG